jgi:AAA15 family ATPase/GTPase
MLIEFAVTNFRSFRERQVLSLLPKKLKERRIELLKTESYSKLEVLPSVVLYGPNNAGKSNLLRAIGVLEQLVRNSGNYNSDKKLDANDFFEFDIKTQNQPTTFEIDFIAPNKSRYRYLVLFNSKIILKEELYVFNVSGTGKTTVKTLFERDQQIIKFPALKGVREGIRFEANQLFLSRGDIEGNKELKEIYSFFSTHLFVYQFTETQYTDFLTKEYAEFIAKNKKGEVDTLIETILRETNTGILGIETDLVDISKIQFPENTPQEIKDSIFEKIKYDLRTRHKLFDGQAEIGKTTLPLNEQSVGTRKLLGLAPLIISALEDGDTLLIDEMNTSMHTEITSWLIDLFNNPITNPNNAQLVITTHDITLLHKDLYEKDQIFIVEKDKYGASDLYSFADVTGIRSNNRLSDYYETGRLGGVPHIAKPYLEHVISQHLKDAKTKEQK